VRQTVYRVGGVFGLDRAFAFLNRGRPIVLAFHGVTADTSRSIHNHDGKHLHLPIFERFMRYMKRHYRPVSLAEIAEWIEHGEALPERAFAVTFDDGYRNVLSRAAPVLDGLGIPATVFVVTDFSFGGRMLWTDRLICALSSTRRPSVRIRRDRGSQELPLSTDSDRIAADVAIRAVAKALPDESRVDMVDRVVESLEVDESRLAADWEDHQPLRPGDLRAVREVGVEVGSHTCSHAIVARLSPDRMSEELGESRRRIEEATGSPCDQFSYPNGAVGDFDGQTHAAARAAGYRCAVTTVKSRVSRDQDPYEIPRYLMAHNEIALSEFAAEVSGYPTMVRSAKNRILRGRERGVGR
jgi:peptidoglycan/xylan/chitin deacetylase (PgdA/CDA1 family)